MYAKIVSFGMRPAARMKVWLESVGAILHPQKPWMDRLTLKCVLPPGQQLLRINGVEIMKTDPWKPKR
jgi:hypothetical protein